MKYKYRLEMYNPVSHHYETVWEGNDQIIAHRMFDKSYNRKSNSRLIKVTEETLISQKVKTHEERS